MRGRWTPSLGAWREAGTTMFRVWAPASTDVTLVKEGDVEERALVSGRDGMFSGVFDDIGPGDRYRYRLDGDGPFPDPASRFQPDGVHGPSMVVDPLRFQWSDAEWQGVAPGALSVYELHVGTFTKEGTFASATRRLPDLVSLGVTAVELMPVADFPGARNWGYDAAAWFAPARCYGTPDDLRAFVDEAHRVGLAVLLDVVYNHSGPDGAYFSRFSPYYFTDRHVSPWGAGIDVEGPHSARVREFVFENALHWIHEYHVDGLRLDATHAIADDSPTHLLAALTDCVRASTERHVHLIAEDHRNLAVMVRPRTSGGWGLDGVWSDDFHHQVRRLLAGDRDGYYRDYSGTTADLAQTIRHGWFYTGQQSEHLGHVRGTPADDVPHERFVVCLQNHDQVGNRAFGERLHHQIDLAAFRAASALLCFVPETPLIFMGQEWAASTPFLYFTDHHAELGRLVTEGRRREFRSFAAFADPSARERIPDPQSAETFEASRLDWDEREREPHASMLRYYRALLALRRGDWEGEAHLTVEAVGADSLALVREWADGRAAACLLRLRGAGMVDFGSPAIADAMPGRSWRQVLSSESPLFAADPQPSSIEWRAEVPRVRFLRPGAVLLEARPVEAACP